jgi:glutamyl-Q tRNA(Asp) synthetase
VNPAYIGRFAPSPTGPLHAGSLVAALASWLDARAHYGQWLVRIEDVDTTRCQSGTDRLILQQLEHCGLRSDKLPVYQSQRSAAYQQALEALVQRGCAYPCACTRKDIELALLQGGQTKPRHGELSYPGTCRQGVLRRRANFGNLAWRLRTDIGMLNDPVDLMHQVHTASFSVAYDSTNRVSEMALAEPVRWADRRLGEQQQDVETAVGDFVLKRSDACFAYQLAVVVDDAWQGVTDVVRGEDLVDNTARQIWLQRALGSPTPRYLHAPLVWGDNGEKLSKQNGAQALDTTRPVVSLHAAAKVLGLQPSQATLAESLAAWVAQWRDFCGQPVG